MEPQPTKTFIPEKPNPENYNPYFGRYINLAFEHPGETLNENGQELVRFFLSIPENKNGNIDMGRTNGHQRKS